MKKKLAQFIGKTLLPARARAYPGAQTYGHAFENHACQYMCAPGTHRGADCTHASLQATELPRRRWGDLMTAPPPPEEPHNGRMASLTQKWRPSQNSVDSFGNQLLSHSKTTQSPIYHAFRVTRSDRHLDSSAVEAPARPQGTRTM